MKPKTVGRVLTQLGAMAQTLSKAPGLVAGTTILTADGALPIEFLNAGDRVISRARGMVRLERIEAETETLHLVRLDTGALGARMPAQPTLVPAAQPILHRRSGQQTVIPAGCLVNEGTIRDIGPRDVRCFRLFFGRPEVIYADGLEVAMAPVATTAARAA